MKPHDRKRYGRWSETSKESLSMLCDFLHTVNETEWNGHAPGTVFVESISGDRDHGSKWSEVWRFGFRDTWQIQVKDAEGVKAFDVYKSATWPDDLIELLPDPDTGLMVGDLVETEYCGETVTASVTHLSMSLNENDEMVSDCAACIVRILNDGTQVAKMKKDLQALKT